jgi:DNA-binding response OmpR family regulator
MDPYASAEGITAPRCVPPLLQRALIIDPDPIAVGALVQQLRSIAYCQVWTAGVADGLELAARVEPTIVFVEQSNGQDGGDFVMRLRRSRAAASKSVAIMLTAEPTVRAIIAARECGAHEVLRKPFARGDLIRRLEAIALEPRGWIEVATYVGPDRRRFNSGDYGVVLKAETSGARAA